VPFVSKVIGVSLARVATLVLAGRSLAELESEGVIPADAGHYRGLPFTAVKAAVLPFGRFPGVDTVLGPEMRSTGEVMGIDADPGAALAKAMVAAGHALPTSGTVFVSVANRDKRAIVFPAKRLADLGFGLLATTGTAGVLRRAGIPVEVVAKVSEAPESADNVAEMIREGRVDLVINTPFGRGPRTDGYHIRTAAAAAGVPCLTTMPGAFAAVRGIEALLAGTTEPKSIQEHHASARARPVQERLWFEPDRARARGTGAA
jgi:carbamoyl-phosphate synthase large subunit